MTPMRRLMSAESSAPPPTVPRSPLDSTIAGGYATALGRQSCPRTTFLLGYVG
jgi:hypothetical protein